MKDLQQGGNALVAGERIAVAFRWPAASGAGVDPSAYLLAASGRVRGDADMIFYNQPADAAGAVRFRPEGAGAFDIDLRAVPAEIERIVFCATIADAHTGARTLALAAGAEIVVSGGDGAPSLRYAPNLVGASEAAMTFGELYRRDGAWKFRAVGQGFAGGLAPLARSFGIDVADMPPPASPPPPPAPPPRPVSLAKVTLAKRQTVSLEKKGASFGEIVVNLNWSRGRGGLFGARAIDLDLGCLFELADGRKQVVQALGEAFGSFDRAPFIALSGDDRTGDVAAGETLRINGAHWGEIRRIVIFAHIYDGAPNWQATDGVVMVSMPDQPPVEVRMTDGRNDHRMCAVVLLENVGGRVNATNVVEYFSGHRDIDRRFGWGLRWVAGHKD